jgi:UDP-N-acetylmuramate dehydrogenase
MYSTDHALIAPLTTLELGGPASRLVVLSEPSDFDELAAEIRCVDPPNIRVIGAGSNILAADAGYEGTLVHMRATGIDVRPHPDGRRVLITAQAGHLLQDLVDEAVHRKLGGVEMLTGIPGTVGATPIQNVGAYGQEVAETIISVRGYDWHTRRHVELSGAECRFGHRTSRFKHSTRWTILSVTFALTPVELSCPLTYRAVAESAGVESGQPVALDVAVAAVRDVRTKKGMVLDPTDADRRSVGSVFLSPIIGAELARALRIAGAPVNEFPDGTTRVSASWLIKEAGFGLGESLASGIRMSNKHFTLVADGPEATAAAFAEASALVVERVFGVTGVRLTAEPDLIGQPPVYEALMAKPRSPDTTVRSSRSNEPGIGCDRVL